MKKPVFMAGGVRFSRHLTAMLPGARFLRNYPFGQAAVLLGMAYVSTVCGSGGSGAGVDAETLENVLQVHFHRVHGATEYGSDLAVGFPLSNPVQHFGLAVRGLELRC